MEWFYKILGSFLERLKKILPMVVKMLAMKILLKLLKMLMHINLLCNWKMDMIRLLVKMVEIFPKDNVSYYVLPVLCLLNHQCLYWMKQHLQLIHVRKDKFKMHLIKWCKVEQHLLLLIVYLQFKRLIKFSLWIMDKLLNKDVMMNY